MEMVQQIFEVCIIPLLGVLTTFLIAYIQKRTKQISNNIDNTTTQKYINLLSNTITSCVIATNQTYVDSLKAQGKFDSQAQKKAFEMTLNAVLIILSDEAKVYLENAYGDLNVYITKQIESTVNQNKIEIK